MITKIIEYFIPPEYHVTEELLRRARLAVGVYIIVTLSTLNYSVLSLIIGYGGGLISQAPLFFISMLCLYLYRRRVAPFVVAFVFFTAAIISISTTILFSGGFSSFIIPWLATTPIVALLVSGKKMGYYTLFAQLGMLIMFYIFELYGISATGKYTTDFPLSFILSCYIGLILIFYAVATVFENGKSYAMNMLYGKNEELQHVIDKLKSTQQQLVQQEKLASLGQLTAGIAHEIKNPLNFVNNFSDLSIELIEEVREEIKNLEISSQNSEVFGILDDIETNLRKIYEHGSRADSIVKSMLQHSRGGDGITEPTDLNALVNEYVNLSFRGMRADKNQMNVDIELKLDESIGEVPLTTEDFSRVIVNLCNNGFDAMRGKLNSEEYTPKLTIRTHQTDTNIILEIEDNGPGIPEEIRDKIMQPFFTTKKGTEGTGLGLYITNDIVKAHGGDIKIVNGSEGALFIITLPKNR